jgi:hypothetical protein
MAAMEVFIFGFRKSALANQPKFDYIASYKFPTSIFSVSSYAPKFSKTYFASASRGRLMPRSFGGFGHSLCRLDRLFFLKTGQPHCAFANRETATGDPFDAAICRPK